MGLKLELKLLFCESSLISVFKLAQSENTSCYYSLILNDSYCADNWI